MRPQVQVSGGNQIGHKLRQMRQKLSGANVYVGIPKAAGNYEDGTPIAVIGAVHEFGANIPHPGGTPYKIVGGGKAQFVKKGTPDADGVTKPHNIPIPERSFLRVPLRANQELFASIFKELLPKVIEGELNMDQLLEQVGQRGAAVSQEAISEGIGPPNAASTKRKKGSSTPLVNDGDLRRSITYVIGEGES